MIEQKIAQSAYDPRIAIYEEMYQQIHRQIFDLIGNANNLVRVAYASQNDISGEHPAYTAIERSFQVTVQLALSQHSIFEASISKTQQKIEDANIPNLTKANMMVAAACTILYQRIWDTVPEDLQALPEINEDTVKQKSNHEGMWQHLLTDSENFNYKQSG